MNADGQGLNRRERRKQRGGLGEAATQKLSGGGPLINECKQDAPSAVQWSDLVSSHICQQDRQGPSPPEAIKGLAQKEKPKLAKDQLWLGAEGAGLSKRTSRR